MDSITYDFRQASPEDSLNNDQQQRQKEKRQDSYFDSLVADFSKPEQDSSSSSPKKKLIIPYNNDSFSSNTSIYSGSRESLAGSDYDVSITSKTAEPDSLISQVGPHEQNLTLDLSTLQERKSSVSSEYDDDDRIGIQIRRQSANSARFCSSPTSARISESWRSDGYQRHRPEVVSRPGSRTQSPIRVLGQQNNPLVSQSLMRMATERMKRKFLGWN